MKQLVTDSTEILSQYNPCKVNDFINTINNKMQSLTDTERSTAYIELEKYNYDYDDNDYYRLSLFWKRFETDAEEQKRKESEKQIQQMKEQHDKRLYEELKKKFG